MLDSRAIFRVFSQCVTRRKLHKAGVGLRGKPDSGPAML
jgi:hypothetical protein